MTWNGEKQRHHMAAKGIKTKIDINNMNTKQENQFYKELKLFVKKGIEIRDLIIAYKCVNKYIPEHKLYDIESIIENLSIEYEKERARIKNVYGIDQYKTAKDILSENKFTRDIWFKNKLIYGIKRM